MAEQLKQSSKLDVRAAVGVARNYFSSIQDLISLEIQDIRLEEVELSEDEQFWLVTLGYNLPKPASPNSLIPEMIKGVEFERYYKIIKINADTKEVESMKIREL